MVTKVKFKMVSLWQKNAGFGLVELLVSISIMILVLGVIMVKHSSFNGATLLRGQAYDIALTVRETQLLAISATDLGSGFRNVYGLHFNTANPTSYKFFRDADNDYFYDAVEEVGKQGQIDRRFEISAIRLIGGGATSQVSLLFERPNFDAKIYTASGVPAGGAVSGVEIDVRVKGTTGTSTGDIRTIEVTRAGQISVKGI
jgi:type II secretory pathway pseudopilin PulG